MIITEFQIDRYRDGHPLKVLDLGNGLNVALASDAMERGAMFHLLPFVLYGGDADRYPKGKVADVLANGTNLVARTDNGVFQIDRRQDSSPPFGSDVTISSPDGSIHDPAYLETLVDGIDPRTFERVFTLGGRQLERNVRRSRNRMLTEMGKIAKYLKHRSPQPTDKSKSPTTSSPNSLNGLGSYVVDLTSLIREQIELDTQSNGKTSTNGSLPTKNRTQTELKKVDAALVEFQQKEQLIARDVLDTQLAIRLSQLQVRLANVQQELAKMGEAPANNSNQDPSNDREVKVIDAEIRRCKQQLEEVSEQRKEAQMAMRGDERFALVKKLHSRIEAVLLQEKLLVNEEQSIQQLASSIRDLESRLETERHQAESHASERSLESSRAMQYLTDIDRFATQLSEAKTQFRQARRRYKNSKPGSKASKSIAGDYVAQPIATVDETDREQIRAAESLVRQLRDRINVESDLNRLTLEHEELFAKVQRLNESNLPPWRVQMAMGIPFMIGAGMTIAGLLGYAQTRWNLVAWGMFIALGSALCKLSLDYRAGGQLAGTRRRLREITRDLQGAERKQNELDDALPDDPSPFKSRLRIAQGCLSDLQSQFSEPSPQRAKRRRRPTVGRSSAEADRLRRRALEARSRFREIGSRWKNLLLDLGLPQTMSPSEARFAIDQRANDHQAISTMPDAALDFQLRQLRHDLERRRNGLNEMLGHARQLVNELGYPANGAAIGEQMDILREAVQEYEEELQNRRKCERTLKELNDRGSQLRKTGRGLSQKRRALNSGARRKEQAEKSRQQVLAEKTRSFEYEREELVRQIDEISHHEGNEVHAAALAELTPTELNARLNELRGQQAAARIEVVKLVELKGRCHERLRLVDHVPKTKKSKARWKDVLAKSLELADLFDTAVGPSETGADELDDDVPILRSATYQYLDRATDHLRALADPQMTQIRLADEEADVEVRTRKGEWQPADKLRPQQLTMLYTCLWLAQLAAFQDQGIHLPIVIDDPLSLVGQKRAGRLAEQLAEFAACGHQVLLVTSNPRHADVFAKLDVPIADFSQRHQSVTPLPESDRWQGTDVIPEPISSDD